MTNHILDSSHIIILFFDVLRKSVFTLVVSLLTSGDHLQRFPKPRAGAGLWTGVGML